MHPNKKEAVLITGASGFLGTYIAESYQRCGNPLLGIDRHSPKDATLWEKFHVGSCETASLEFFLKHFEVSTVFHLAGAASVPDSVQAPFHDFESSVPGTVKLLSEVIRHRPSAHVIFISSAAVYGNPASLPIGEHAAVAPISPYGIHKAISELALEHYGRLYNLKVSILRVFSAFGPGLRKQLFWDLSRRAFEALARGEKSIVLQGTGRDSRDFIYASDVAKAALHIARRSMSPSFEVFNVGSGIGTSIRDAANQLIRHLDLDLDLVFDGVERSGVPHSWCADVTKLTKSGFRPDIPLSEGIESLAIWLKDDWRSSASK
jgi:UDP-glucose 4-epimerase